MRARFALGVLILALSACAQTPIQRPLQAPQDACTQAFVRSDAAITRAKVRDGGSHRVAGFPYLRTNRFLASFAQQAQSTQQALAWVSAMRKLDQNLRTIELTNLGLAPAAREQTLLELARCGEKLSAELLASPPALQKLRGSARVPDDYSSAARLLGAYPLTAPLLTRGVKQWQDNVREQYRSSLKQLWRGNELVGWYPQREHTDTRESARLIKGARRDALGIARLDPAQWTLITDTYAPVWMIDTAGDYDAIGKPTLRQPPGVDLRAPVVYVQPGHTRFGGQVLLQLSYVAWFDQRPADGAMDSYAGALDGVIWRVTFDADGEVLLYDSIHACGCYHYLFAAAPLVPRKIDAKQEAPLLPQTGKLPKQRLAIVLQSGTHSILRVTRALDVSRTAFYRLAAYSSLLQLPDGSGRTRSLFDQNGIVPGTQRSERLWLWPSGVVSPGAMRQWGRHATAFTGTRHFDDADLLDQLFVSKSAATAASDPPRKTR